jgi:hypothetical protein
MSSASGPWQPLSRQDLDTVAIYQEVILLCIPCYLGAVAAQFAVPEDLRMFLLLQKPGSDSNYELTPCPADRVRA